MDFYFSSINIVTVYNEKFNISDEVAYKARRLAALRQMTWDIRVDVEKQVQKNQEAKKKAKKEKKRLKKERERRSKENAPEKDFSETDTNDKDEYCYRGERNKIFFLFRRLPDIFSNEKIWKIFNSNVFSWKKNCVSEAHFPKWTLSQMGVFLNEYL